MNQSYSCCFDTPILLDKEHTLLAATKPSLLAKTRHAKKNSLSLLSPPQPPPQRPSFLSSLTSFSHCSLQFAFNKHSQMTFVTLIVVGLLSSVALVNASEPMIQQHVDYSNILDSSACLSSKACQQKLLAVEHKRKSAYMRFGRSVNFLTDDNAFENFEKRKSAYMRFGKRFAPYVAGDDTFFYPIVDKRKSAYMRFGKRKSAYMRFGKRDSETELDMAPMEKRKSAYMRFGKRVPLSLVDENGPMKKRKSAYMRFGRK